MNRDVTVGSTWIHFTGDIATVIAVAAHAETSEQLVIYDCYNNTTKESCATKESCGVFARPKSKFLAEVDKAMYPNAKQKYLFERVC